MGGGLITTHWWGLFLEYEIIARGSKNWFFLPPPCFFSGTALNPFNTEATTFLNGTKMQNFFEKPFMLVFIGKLLPSPIR